MPGNEKLKEITSGGNEWEVVSLTASTYAAAPGPQNVELKDDNRGDNVEESNTETSRALFMSSHFVFPPSEHENLPLEHEPVKSVIYDDPVGKDVISEFGVEVGERSSGKDDEDNCTLKDLSVHDEFPEMHVFDEKVNKISFSDTGREFEEGTTLPGLNLTGKEESSCSADTFSSFHSEAALVGSASYVENVEAAEITETSEQGLDLPAKEEEKYAESILPGDAWWKRRAASLYAHAKEANTFWSIFIAAAVMGVVIIGQRWQQEKWQALQHKWQLNISDEKPSRVLGPISRLKDSIVVGHRRGSFVRGA